MNSLFETFNLLQTAAPAGGSGSMLYTLGMFGLVFLIFYLLIIRPQNKRQKETHRYGVRPLGNRQCHQSRS
jgi:preprotein translocase subunit YajC